MDIVEQLRKYQCPENKGCNPVVDYCQCALMDSGADEIERLREALKIISCKCKSNCGKDEGNCLYWVARSALQ